MPVITEFLNGGLVTARPGSLLFPGELQRANDCVYRDQNSAIQRTPARTAYNSTALAGGIRGLDQLTFDQNTDQLLAWPQGDGTTSYLYSSDFTALTGEFSPITGPGILSCITHTTTTIDSVVVGAFSDMIIGTKVSGSGIPPGTYVKTVLTSSQIIISNPATASATVTLVFDAGIAFPMSDTGQESLDTIQWQDTFFVLPKVGAVSRMFWKQFVGSDASEELIMRPAGLQPIATFPPANVTVQTGAAWSATLGVGFYWFLITEIRVSDAPGVDDIEAGYTANKGQAIAVQINDTAFNQFVRIVFPSVTNDGTGGKNKATNWGVYMSTEGKTNPSVMPSPATFKRIAMPSIEETQLDLKFTNASQDFKLPTATGVGPDSLPQFTNPSGFLDIGGTPAVGISGGGQSQENALSVFNFLTGAPWSTYTVTGIEVKVVARSLSPGSSGYWVWVDQGIGNASGSRNFGIFTGFSYASQFWGGQFEKWGLSWTPGQVGSLRVVVQKSYTAANQTIEIDYITVKVYYSGAAATDGSINLDGPPYQVVTYRSQIGTTISDPANYLIPTASTGDIFQGSLVLNDTGFPSRIAYSLPGVPESFPKPYEIKFNSKNKDIVTYIRRLNQILIVGMRDSIKRVNYLPTEADVDFGKGVAHEDIVVDQGIVGPLAATIFDIPRIGTVCGFVSYNGFYITEGITVRPFNLDLDFKNLVKTEALSTSILKAYPKEKWLVFYYCPKGATHNKNTRAIVFHYQQDKIKEGGYLPATGPIKVSARSVVSAKLSGVPYLITGHESTGLIYIEDNTDIQPTTYQIHDENDVLTSAPIIPSIITRKVFPSGYDKDTREQRIYLIYDADGEYQEIPCTINSQSYNVTSTGFFTDVVIGMRVKGDNILPGTIVTAVDDVNNITLSQLPEASEDAVLVFDDGTISIGVRGSGIYDAPILFNTRYFSTLFGDLLVSEQDNYSQGLELLIEKVYINEDVSVDLDRALKIYNFTYLATVAGTEQNRAT